MSVREGNLESSAVLPRAAEANGAHRMPSPLPAAPMDSRAATLERVLDILDERTVGILKHRHSKKRLHRRGWLLRRMLLAADLAGITIAFFLAQQFLVDPRGDKISPLGEVGLFLVALPVWVIAANLGGLYDRDGERTDHSTVDDLLGVFSVITIGTWIVSAMAWMTHVLNPYPPRMIAFWAMAIGLVVGGRIAARTLARRSVAYVQNTVIVGAGDVGQLAARKIMQHPEYGVNIVGFIDAEPKDRRPELRLLPVLGTTADLPDLVGPLDLERVIIAFSGDRHEETLQVIRSMRSRNVQVDVIPRLFEVVGPKAGIHTLEGMPVVGLPAARLQRHSRVVKRSIDILGAALALIVVSPLFAFIAWRVKRDSPGPVFFRQKRLGMNMRNFDTLKFRSMYVDTDASPHREYMLAMMDPATPVGQNGLYKLDQDRAITPFGRWLRRTSLDELPQLINVLLGDMSLVGPRPCIEYETEHFAPHHFERFLVPAGLTGLWQVTARARATFGEALEMDVAYARGWSLGLDLRLICRTPLAVMRQMGAA